MDRVNDETIGQRVFGLYVLNGLNIVDIAQKLALDQESVRAMLQVEANRAAAERAATREVEFARSLAIYRTVLEHALSKPRTPSWSRTIIMAQGSIDRLLGLSAPSRLALEPHRESVPLLLDADAGFAALERIIAEHSVDVDEDNNAS